MSRAGAGERILCSQIDYGPFSVVLSPSRGFGCFLLVSSQAYQGASLRGHIL